MKQAITSPDAPNPAGAYSPALRVGQLLFMSGQIPIDPATGQLVTGDAAVTRDARWTPWGALPAAAELSFAHVVRTTVFLADMNDFAVVNDVYASYFGDPKPARVTVQAAKLRGDARTKLTRSPATTFSTRPLPRLVPPNVRPPQHLADRAERLHHGSRCARSLISTVTPMRARWSSSVCASMLRMLVLMAAILALTAARRPLPGPPLPS